MTARPVILTVFVCAVLGFWLPSLWLPSAAEKSRPLPSPPPLQQMRPLAPQDLAAAVRAASSPMAKLQALVAGLTNRRPGLSFRPADLGDLDSDLAQELAVPLAGEALGGNVSDGTAFLDSLKKEYGSDHSFKTAAVQAWAEKNPDAALTALLSSSGSGLWLYNGVVTQLAVRDPDKVLARLKAAPFLPHLIRLWEAAMEGFAQKDPAFALSAIQSAPAAAREQGIAYLFTALAVKDARAALTWRETLPPELREHTDPWHAYLEWAKTDPATALKESLAAGEHVSSNDLVIELWADKDPEAVLQWALAKGEEGTESAENALREVAKKDHRRALDILSRVPPDLQKSLRPHIADSWADSDPSAALAWARSLPAADRPDVLTAMLGDLRELPPEELRTIAREIGLETPVGFGFLRTVDPAAADTILAAMPPESARTIRKDLARDMADSSPEETAALLQPLLIAESTPPANPDSADSTPAPHSSDSSDIATIVAELTATWARRDPAATAAWVTRLPADSPHLSTATVNLALAWSRYDTAAARAWVDHLPPGNPRDQALRKINELTTPDPPETPGDPP